MRISPKILLFAAAMALSPAARAAEAPMPVESNIAVEAPVVKAMAGCISVDIPGAQEQHVSIYSITGQAVKEFTAAPGHYDIELPKGCYIVRVGAHTIKIVVK